MTGNTDDDHCDATLGAATVYQIAVPLAALERSTLARVDYQDAFLVEIEDVRGWTGERWARAVLEEAPDSTRRGLIRGWKSLGLEVNPSRSEGFILGWEVRHSSPDLALLGSAGRFGVSGELLFGARENALLFATFVQLDNPVARVMWRCLAPHHRLVVRRLLMQAATTSHTERPGSPGVGGGR